ncbi:hypothetical protein RB11867 [Rhodopirellula baltica SH 1]|uniref:Uncharacterized protein n=1 Tax=Rhodopirellula baltica (strain DSM 10527 / NCIMB 13988 / SH1) TaxID=243090 RepID=Q7UJI9_RHOBA|nr:hypothetical protein RB11867 [Rhodopirellula baltica SH 1]
MSCLLFTPLVFVRGVTRLVTGERCRCHPRQTPGKPVAEPRIRYAPH